MNRWAALTGFVLAIAGSANSADADDVSAITLIHPKHDYVSGICGRRFYVWDRPPLPFIADKPLPRPSAGAIMISAPVPDTIPIVSCDFVSRSTDRDILAVLRNGDIYWWRVSTLKSVPSNWEYAGNLTGLRSQTEMDSLRVASTRR
jgi:hypothetical protein